MNRWGAAKSARSGVLTGLLFVLASGIGINTGDVIVGNIECAGRIFKLHAGAPGTRSDVTEDRRSEQVAGACGAHHGLAGGGADAS